MKLLSNEETEAYSEFMDKVAVLIYKHTCKGLDELGSLENATKNNEELGWAVGQIVHDEILAHTKEMAPEIVMRWFTETTIALLVKSMNDNPLFFARIALLSTRS